MASYFLNPEYFYDNRSRIMGDGVVRDKLDQCIRRLVPDINKQDKIFEELTSYIEEKGLFGMPAAIRHRNKNTPGILFVSLCYLFVCPFD